MRLLNVYTLRVENFAEIDPQKQKFAILSHTWEADGEVTFTDMEAYHRRHRRRRRRRRRRRDHDDPADSDEESEDEADLEVTKPRGFDKIKQCCRLAREAGYEYAWVDTCCIDKTSSAELSESINSMFRLYAESQVCYAYLSDVTAEAGDPVILSKQGQKGSVIASRWFTRGWTLQELIAPRNVVFYSARWTQIGTKKDLYALIKRATGIDKETLVGSKPIHKSSVARRMSWASRRNTTRTEDIAYCLLGIFDIQMPLLYGEGKKAFTRLQEEIIRSCDDHTIFAWVDSEAQEHEKRTMLASSPKDFKRSADYVPYLELGHEYLDITLSNTSIILKAATVKDDEDHLLMALHCLKSGRIDEFVYVRLDPDTGDSRINASQLFLRGAEAGDLEIQRLARSKVAHDRELVPLAGQWLSLKKGKWAEEIEIEKFWIMSPSGTVKRSDTGRVSVFPHDDWLEASKFGSPMDSSFLIPPRGRDVIGIWLKNVSVVETPIYNEDTPDERVQFFISVNEHGRLAAATDQYKFDSIYGNWHEERKVDEAGRIVSSEIKYEADARIREDFEKTWTIGLREVPKDQLGPGEIGVYVDFEFAVSKERATRRERLRNYVSGRALRLLGI